METRDINLMAINDKIIKVIQKNADNKELYNDLMEILDLVGKETTNISNIRDILKDMVDKL